MSVELKHEAAAQREAISHARRVVIKLGTRVLVQRNGRPDRRRMRELVAQIAAVRRGGREVIVVSSGAIGAGMATLGLKSRPTALPELQMAAAVGQSRLMAHYDELFSAERCTIAQVLLTHDDLRHRVRHLNARNTLMTLLRHGIVPIVNENDAVAVDEIKFGDNDLLASLVTLLVDAELLLLLSTTDGLRAPGVGKRTRRVAYLPAVTEEALALASGKGSALSTGGMASKLGSTQTVARVGGVAVIADGRRAGTISRVLAGEDVGTLIGRFARRDGGLTARKRWIAYFHKAQGALVVDAGAVQALQKGGRSLLPAGVRAVEGRFEVGAVVTIKSPDGSVVARGLTEYASADLERIKGRRTHELGALLGRPHDDEVVHRDNLVLV